MPTHEPELSEPYYNGEHREAGRGNLIGVVEYLYTEDDGYSYDPDAEGEVEWFTEPVASDVDWSDDSERRNVGAAILKHLFKRAATNDELDQFMEHVAPTLEDGMPFAVTVRQLRDAGLER